MGYQRNLPAHGSPADRGDADAYYGRPARPHWWPEGTSVGSEVTAEAMTPEQIKEYNDAYDAHNFKKVW